LGIIEVNIPVTDAISNDRVDLKANREERTMNETDKPICHSIRANSVFPKARDEKLNNTSNSPKP
jgi:hypothetical protein